MRNTDKERKKFLQCCDRYGLHESDLGRTFVYNNTLYVIEGMSPPGISFKGILARSSRGEYMYFKVDTVHKLLPKATSASVPGSEGVFPKGDLRGLQSEGW